jgi:hypothetical protein
MCQLLVWRADTGTGGVTWPRPGPLTAQAQAAFLNRDLEFRELTRSRRLQVGTVTLRLMSPTVTVTTRCECALTGRLRVLTATACLD